jgi:hypothetical protein
MRDHIISEIRRLAAEKGGVPPGEKLFGSATGITPRKWTGIYWARWSEALGEAGFPPNAWTARLDSRIVLKQVAAFCRELGRLPTNSEIRIRSRTDPRFPGDTTLRRHFGGTIHLAAALRRLAADDPAWADLLDRLPEEDRSPVAPALPAPGAAAAPPPESPAQPEGLVYLLKSGPHYKIGQSRDIERRFRSIGLALPEPIVLVHAIRTDDPRGIEAYWHRRFAAKRRNGEWFALAGEDVEAFQRRVFQ